MNVALWILAGVLAFALLGAGGMKLALTKDALAGKGVDLLSLPAPLVKFIGFAEVCGALGLILPGLLHVVPSLVPVAAACVAVLLAGAVAFHLSRREGKGAFPPVVLLIMAIVVAWGRFGPYAF